jgi:hypothetical protein
MARMSLVDLSEVWSCDQAWTRTPSPSSRSMSSCGCTKSRVIPQMDFADASLSPARVDFIDPGGVLWRYIAEAEEFSPSSIPSEFRRNFDKTWHAVAFGGGKVYIRTKPYEHEQGPEVNRNPEFQYNGSQGGFGQLGVSYYGATLQQQGLGEFPNEIGLIPQASAKFSTWLSPEQTISAPVRAAGAVFNPGPLVNGSFSWNPNSSRPPRGAGSTCTATVVGARNLIITAAHCMWNRDTNQWRSPGFQFIPAARRKIDPSNPPRAGSQTAEILNNALSTGQPIPPNLVTQTIWDHPLGYYSFYPQGTLPGYYLGPGAIFASGYFFVEECHEDWALCFLNRRVTAAIEPFGFGNRASLWKHVDMFHYPPTSEENGFSATSGRRSHGRILSVGLGFTHDLNSWGGSSGAAVVELRDDGPPIIVGINKGRCGATQWYAARVDNGLRNQISEAVQTANSLPGPG